MHERGQRPRWTRGAEAALLALPLLWLTWAAIRVQVEPYDGFDAICNAGHILGETAHFVDNRAPLMAWLLLPAAWARRALGLQPFDVRPYHAVSALLHAGYLLGVYGFLRTRLPSVRLCLAVFLTAVLNVVFFCYGCFISHDLCPGLILLWMVWLGTRYCKPSPEPGKDGDDRGLRAGCWLLLVLLGAAAALVKQTYGVFWVGVLAGCGVNHVRCPPAHRCAARRALAELALAAACSAGIYWVVMGWVLAPNLPDTALLLRPWRQIVWVAGQYGDSGVRFPWWVYLRNCHAYGLTTVVLIVPGLIAALRPRGNARSSQLTGITDQPLAESRQTAFFRAAACAWLCGIVVLQVTSMREVRYLAFLMPLSACLIALPLQRAWSRPAWRWMLAVLLLGDAARAGFEAMRLRADFYRHNPAVSFLAALQEDTVRRRRPLFMYRPLCFRPPGSRAFAGDRYHRLFHLGVHHVRILSGYEREELFRVPKEEQIYLLAAEHPTSALLYSNRSLTNPPSLLRTVPTALTDHESCIAVADSFRLPTSQDATPVPQWFQGEVPGTAVARFQNPDLDAWLRGTLFAGLVLRGEGGSIAAPLIRRHAHGITEAVFPASALPGVTLQAPRVAAYRVLHRYRTIAPGSP